jgi:hypothetical protein
MDEGSLEEQLEYMEAFSFKKSAIVYSGGKSLHYLISLADVTLTAEQWRFLNQWVLNILSKADQQVKNPSRKTRFPGHLRDGKTIQELKVVGERLPYKDLIAWLIQFPEKRPDWKPERTLEKRERLYRNFFNGNYREVPRWLRSKLEEGVDFNRNQTWFNYSCILAEAGFDEFEILEIFEDYFLVERDFTQRELETCVRSAVERIERDGGEP